LKAHSKEWAFILFRRGKFAVRPTRELAREIRCTGLLVIRVS